MRLCIAVSLVVTGLVLTAPAAVDVDPDRVADEVRHGVVWREAHGSGFRLLSSELDGTDRHVIFRQKSSGMSATSVPVGFSAIDPMSPAAFCLKIT